MLQALVENVSEIVVVIDAEGILRYCNPQLERVLGMRCEDVLRKNIFDFIHPEDVGRARLEYSETIKKSGEGVPSILRIRDASGTWIPFEIIANNLLTDPDIHGVIFTARDLRFRQEIENAIRLANADIERRIEERTIELAKANAALRLENQSHGETERRLQQTISLLNATLNSTADGILVVGRDGKVSGCNQHFIQMWKLRCDSAVGMNDLDLLSSVLDQLQDPEGFLVKVNALYADKTATSFDVLLFKDGRIYERYSQPQLLEDQVVGRVWSFRDVTEARRLEEDLRQSQKLEAIGRLASGVAHDFNNLLMLISGYLGRLSVSPLSSEQKHTCEQALETTKRAASLTRQLLTFGRKHPDAPRVTNLNEVISNVRSMLRSLVSQSIRLDISLSEDPIPIFADVVQLEVVLMNLAINAHDAMPDGGTLSIVAGRTERDSRTFAALTVTDSGKGMTPVVRSRVFEPFFTTKEVGKGTGLGLSTVYGIVKRAGGHIEVDSEPNRGTQFRIYLPQTKAVPESSTISAASQPERGHETILLAEDEIGIRAMTRAYLESLGYHVLEASDGSEAVKISRRYNGPIDVVLTDLFMPMMRGDAVVESIRKHRPGVKALYISGSLEESGGNGKMNVLAKPFEFPELGRRLRTLLEPDVKLRKPA